LTLANKVTLARIALIPFCLAFLLTGFYGLAAVAFVILAFSDAIDGYIARKYNQVSDLGKQLDPLADKILVMTVLIGLTALGKAGALPVMLIFVREFIIASIRGKKVFAASPIAKWKTIIQMVAVFMCILSLPLSELALWLAVILSYISGGAYLWQSQLLKQLRIS
jgi:CDP-diacylglycerol--glycerol-3-phosphate 3-phosphatidyltransferase